MSMLPFFNTDSESAADALVRVVRLTVTAFTFIGLMLSVGIVISMIFREMLSFIAVVASRSQWALRQLSTCIAMLSVFSDCRFVEHAVASRHAVRARRVFGFRHIRVV